jgi:biotin transporter BioY
MLAIINIAFCYTAIIISGLTQISLISFCPELNVFMGYEYSLLYITTFSLSLGFRHNFAFMAVLLYLVSGLAGLPVFAFGGTWRYFLEPSFGFLFGLIPLTISSFYHHNHVSDSKLKTLCGCNLSPIYGLMIAHGCGLGFLILTARFNFSEFLNLHIYQLVYDMIFAYLIIMLINIFKPKNFEPEVSL